MSTYTDMLRVLARRFADESREVAVAERNFSSVDAARKAAHARRAETWRELAKSVGPNIRRRAFVVDGKVVLVEHVAESGEHDPRAMIEVLDAEVIS